MANVDARVTGTGSVYASSVVEPHTVPGAVAPYAGQDNVDPVVSDISQPDMSELTKDTPITFSVGDAQSQIAKVLIFVKYESSANPWLIYDGEEFLGLWSFRSTVTGNEDDGYEFSVLPLGGWQGGFTLSIFTGDGAGNMDGDI